VKDIKMKSLKIIATAIVASSMFVAMPVIADSHGKKMQMQHGETVMLGDLTLSGAFTRAMPDGAKAAGGFVTIANGGKESDRLVSASSANADMVQLHEMKIIDDIMKMQEMKEGIIIPAGETVTLKPGGLHVMFMKITKPFVMGEMVPVTLTFEKAGSVDIMMPIGEMGMKMKH
jgi:hypothetical protein